MSERTIEYCFRCGSATGKAGKSDDSLYIDDGSGPYCNPCYDNALVSLLTAERNALRTRNASLEATVSQFTIDLALNGTMLARQTDLAREAENQRAALAARLERVEKALADDVKAFEYIVEADKTRYDYDPGKRKSDIAKKPDGSLPPVGQCWLTPKEKALARLKEIRAAAPAKPCGTCCDCGYSGTEETECPKREDKTHCEHWWDGPDCAGSPGTANPGHPPLDGARGER